MNLVSSHDVGRALHHLGWQSEGDDAATVARAKQRLRLATFIQMTSPGAPMVCYGDEVGVTGGDDPYNRATYPWADQGGQPDLALLADFKTLIQMRHRHAVLRRGSTEAPLYADDHVVVQARRLGAAWALVATNNAAEPRTVRLRLPAGMSQLRWRNALGSANPRWQDGIAELVVPPVYGSVLIGR
jgi:glycosidase